MFEFLADTENLQHFYYTSDELASNGANFHPFLIRSVLLSNAQFTLRTLIILAGENEKCFMGSLADFTCLESVQTDLQLLVGDP